MYSADPHVFDNENPPKLFALGGGTFRETIRPLFSLPLYSKDNDNNQNNQHRCADAEIENEIQL